MFCCLYHACVAHGYSCPFIFGEEKLMQNGPYESTVMALFETTLHRLTLATMKNNFHSYGKKLEVHNAYKQKSAAGRMKRKWNDDVVFRNQARGESTGMKKGFINDTVRYDFNRRFLDKFIL
jgi:hypothetical protein